MGYLEQKIDELSNYLPALTKEPDFELFWETVLREAEKKPLNAVMKQVDYPASYVEVYDISYEGYDDTRIHGWFLKPRFGPKDHLPCLIQYHGFTGHRGYPSQLMHWVSMGLAVLAVDCRDQGGITGNCASYHGSGMVSNVVTKGITSKEEYYYKAVYVDSIKAIDFVSELPEIDMSRIIVRGTSQGGALGMAVSALDHRPAVAIVNVPSNSNLTARVEGNHGSFAAVNAYLRVFPEQTDEVLKTLSYFDTMNMADKIECPVFASVALGDQTCPAKCYFASYNRIKAPKQITVYPFNEHDGAGAFHLEKEMRYLKEHIPGLSS